MRRIDSAARMPVCMIAVAAALTTLSQLAAGQRGTPTAAAMPCERGMMAPDSATRAHMMAIRDLLMNNDKITRTVSNLPNGVRTVTESSDPRIAQLIKTHVAQMDGRSIAGEHLGTPMESPALRAIINGKQRIRTTMDMTEKGVVLVQTSTYPRLVTALQKHAEEVSALVKGGMPAMQQKMMPMMQHQMMPMRDSATWMPPCAPPAKPPEP